ncbi:uncharacterized protein RCC_08707 [Ramularia collo-cygni]|uniref:Uncharacterized protein n=1 Tax=Ramularia collo-cygni TaxID=112498 RepID=A0A2D3VIE9_9PEZI|nr:uncharacterized protein RCC_08707 [Ramularia collo-cygni]CZT22999.1 uncharacterized protein RCC_08707 [Ramularia collo-cygni]
MFLFSMLFMSSTNIIIRTMIVFIILKASAYAIVESYRFGKPFLDVLLSDIASSLHSTTSKQIKDCQREHPDVFPSSDNSNSRHDPSSFASDEARAVALHQFDINRPEASCPERWIYPNEYNSKRLENFYRNPPNWNLPLNPDSDELREWDEHGEYRPLPITDNCIVGKKNGERHRNNTSLRYERKGDPKVHEKVPARRHRASSSRHHLRRVRSFNAPDALRNEFHESYRMHMDRDGYGGH